MRSPDSFRQTLQQLTASIKAWSGFVGDVARVEVREDGLAWRVAMQPFIAGACPLVLELKGSGEACDLEVGNQRYTDWPLASIDLILPLMEAVVEGNVITRRMSSAATGAPLGITTEIRLADGRVLEPAEAARPNGLFPGAVEGRVTHYLPYRRPGTGR